MIDSIHLNLEENGFIGNDSLTYFEKEQKGVFFKIKISIELDDGSISRKTSSLMIIRFHDKLSYRMRSKGPGTLIIEIINYELSLKINKVLDSIPLLEEICFYVNREMKKPYNKSFKDESNGNHIEFHSFRDVLCFNGSEPVYYCKKNAHDI